MEMKWDKAFELLSIELQEAMWDLDSFLAENPNMIPAQREIDRDLAAIGENPSARIKYFIEKIQEKRVLLEEIMNEMALASESK